MKKTKKESPEFKWLSIPKELVKRFSSTLGVRGLAVYLLLTTYANKEFRCRLDFYKVSKKLNLTNAQAIRALHQLEDLHIIRGEPRESKSRYYKLLWVPPWGKVGEKEEKKSAPYRIDISINNKRIDNDIDELIRKIISKKSMCQIDPNTLAYELAEALNDKEAIQMYIAYVNRFPESLLREVLVKVLAVPENKIRKTRGALFNYLIQQHANSTKYYPRA